MIRETRTANHALLGGALALFLGLGCADGSSTKNDAGAGGDTSQGGDTSGVESTDTSPDQRHVPDIGHDLGGGDAQLYVVLYTSPEKVDFGPVQLGRSKTASMAVHNAGRSPTQLTVLELEPSVGDEDFAIDADGCSGKSVGPGDSCEIQILFTPVAPGSRRQVVSIQGRPAGGTIMSEVRGEGVPVQDAGTGGN